MLCLKGITTVLERQVELCQEQQAFECFPNMTEHVEWVISTCTYPEYFMNSNKNVKEMVMGSLGHKDI